MKKCKMASEASCGKNVCCAFCDEVESCHDRCTDYKEYETCEHAYEEGFELQAFESAVPDAIRVITDITLKKKALEDEEKTMKEKLLAAMETYGVKKFENEHFSITYVAPTTRSTIDSAKLKKDLPDVAEKYSKTSNVKASVRIGVK